MRSRLEKWSLGVPVLIENQSLLGALAMDTGKGSRRARIECGLERSLMDSMKRNPRKKKGIKEG
jgi:hypothetical protein